MTDESKRKLIGRMLLAWSVAACAGLVFCAISLVMGLIEYMRFINKQ